MVKSIKHKITFGLLVIALMLLPGTFTSAASYNYKMNNGDSVDAPISYKVGRTIYAKDLGVDSLSMITSIFVSNNKIYLADLDKIIIMDINFKVLNILSEYEEQGEMSQINNPEGLFVTDLGDIYVTDPNKARILKFNSNLDLIRTFDKPEDMGLEGVAYKPSKIVVDTVGRMYITAKNVYEGILELNSSGEFSRYFGVNSVTFDVLDLFWRAIATDAQRAKMQLWLPTEFTNLAVNKEGFIFTTSKSENEGEPIKLLNAKGENILTAVADDLYPQGDLDYTLSGTGVSGASNLIAIDCNEYGMYSVLDSKRNRVFTYDENGYLLYIFGGLGDREGTFRNPVDLKFMGENILIIDQMAQSIVVMEPTNYAKLINEATRLQFDGMLFEASELWKEVSIMNPNLELAYVGLGKTSLRNGEYEDAAKLFKLGNAKDKYSKAFDKVRDDYIDKNFSIFTGIFILIVLLIVSHKIYKKVKYGKRIERSEE